MKAEKMHTATNEARPKYTRQQMKQGQNDVDQPKTEAEMSKKTNKFDTCQQQEHGHNRFFPRQLFYKT